jgi:hypothetical protein
MVKFFAEEVEVFGAVDATKEPSDEVGGKQRPIAVLFDETVCNEAIERLCEDI